MGVDIGEDTAWIRNLKLTGAGAVTITAEADDPDWGSVTGNDLGVYNVGEEVTLTAVTSQGGQFYGWVVNGELVSRETVYTFPAIEDTAVTAVFAAAGTYVARIEGKFYETVSGALDKAQSGDTVILLKDASLTGSVEVPESVTLLLPYDAADKTGINTDGGSHTRVSWNDSVKPYVTLTIPAETTLTVNGSMTVGGVTNKEDQTAQGHTSGDYAQAVVDGTLVVNGSLDVRGLMTGSGTTRLNKGGEMLMPFLVTDYNGGTNTDALYSANVFPFGQYATVNVQNTLVMEGGATLTGATSLYAMDSLFSQDVPLVAVDAGLIHLPEGSTLTATYDPNKVVGTTLGNINLTDFGKTTLTIEGNASAGGFEIKYGYVTYGSRGMYLNIPYTYDLVLKNGEFTMGDFYRIMPGATVTVEEGATLNVTGGLQVTDGWQQAMLSYKQYPSSALLKQYGFSRTGNLIVNGTLNVSSNATFAGIVQTSGEAGTINLASNAKLAGRSNCRPWP